MSPSSPPRKSAKATGLGLATVMGIVKQHGGFLKVYSEIAKGTVFHVYVPAIEGVADPLLHPDDTPVRGGTETILVAEDHHGMREMAQEILEASGLKFDPCLR